MTKKLNGKLVVLQHRLNALLAKQLELNASVAHLDSYMVHASVDASLAHLQTLNTPRVEGQSWPAPDLRKYNKLQIEHAEFSRQARANQLEIVDVLKKMNEEIPAPKERPRVPESKL